MQRRLTTRAPAGGRRLGVDLASCGARLHSWLGRSAPVWSTWVCECCAMFAVAAPALPSRTPLTPSLPHACDAAQHRSLWRPAARVLKCLPAATAVNGGLASPRGGCASLAPAQAARQQAGRSHGLVHHAPLGDSHCPHSPLTPATGGCAGPTTPARNIRSSAVAQAASANPVAREGAQPCSWLAMGRSAGSRVRNSTAWHAAQVMRPAEHPR